MGPEGVGACGLGAGVADQIISGSQVMGQKGITRLHADSFGGQALIRKQTQQFAYQWFVGIDDDFVKIGDLEQLAQLDFGKAETGGSKGPHVFFGNTLAAGTHWQNDRDA
jgi:hypothetical protein